MPVNTALAHVSNGFLLVALTAYAVAVLAFAADFAFGRRGAAAGAARRVPALVTVGAASRGTAAGSGGAPGSDGAAGSDRAADGESARPQPAPAATGSMPGRWVRAALAATSIGLAAHVLGVITRGLAVHRIPWGDMYEFVVALTCVAVACFLFLAIRFRAYHVGLFVMGAVVIALGLAETVIYTAAGPLVPALQSYWLSIHVTAMTLATGTYFVAAVLGVVYLVSEHNVRRAAAGRGSAAALMARLPAPEALDRYAYRTVVFAFPIWTFGIIAGAIWADQAWGRYWGWDPTETWAFITWVVYACFLHARATAGWRGRKAQIIQLAGFGCLLFNLVGVSLFINGLHSYAGLN